MIETRHLHDIVTTADMGSFNRAAGAMRIKQSTLSRRIRHLELRLGIVLFERSTCGVNLTQAGMRFLDRARQVLDDLACGRISALL
jgi:DNA-binding transcriptional LysR family regulator